MTPWLLNLPDRRKGDIIMDTSVRPLWITLRVRFRGIRVIQHGRMPRLGPRALFS